MKEGQLIIVNKILNMGPYVLCKGALLKVNSYNTKNNVFSFTIMYNFGNSNNNYIGTSSEVFNDSSYFNITGLTAEDYKTGVIKLYDIVANELIWNIDSSKKVNKTPKIPLKLLKKTYKYIPIKYDGNYGFYDEERNLLVFLLDRNMQDIILVIPNTIKDISNYYNTKILFSKCEFNVKNYFKSAKLFGRVNTKKELVGKVLKSEKEDIVLDEEHKKTKVKESTITLKCGETNLKWCLDDIEIIYPNIKGYNTRLDREIHINDTCIVSNTRKINHALKSHEKVLIKDIKEVKAYKGVKKYVGVEINGKITYLNSKGFKKIGDNRIKTIVSRKKSNNSKTKVTNIPSSYTSSPGTFKDYYNHLINSYSSDNQKIKVEF